MAALNQHITEKVAGDSLRIQDTYIELPTGITINKAWLTIKEYAADADIGAVIQKSITTSLTTSGQITDATSTTDLAISLFFDLTPAETILLEPYRPYEYDIQVKTTDSAIYTCVMGQIIMEQGVTVTTT